MKLRVGDSIWDQLTGQVAKVIRLDRDKDGNLGIWLDNDYLGGGRHPWEVTQLDADGNFIVPYLGDSDEV